MGKQRGLGGWSDPPSEVRITVLQDPADRRPWQQLSARRGVEVPRRTYGLLVFGAIVVAVGVALATTSLNGPAGGSRRVTIRPREGGPTVAAAYGYPIRCLSVTVSSIDPAFARADFNHASPCGRYAGDPTAIFHLVDRAWRPVLEAVSYPCPATGIPPAVQRELAVCPGATGSRRRR